MKFPDIVMDLYYVINELGYHTVAILSPTTSTTTIEVAI